MLELHEALFVLRAYPDDEEVLAQVVRMLEGFGARRDLRRSRQELADTGVVGTDIHYAYYQPQARDLVDRYGDAVEVDWAEFRGKPKLLLWLEALMLESEAPALDEVKLSPPQWIERMKRPGETDAAFSAGSPDDVHVIDLGAGLELVAVGLLPHERLVVEALYGFLMLKNGVPVGYTLAGAMFRSSDVAYNVFETYRGAEAAQMYGRVLAAMRAFLGATHYCVVPYQLGHGNEEGLASGAWWFYQKLGFRPRDPDVLALMERELAVMKRNRKHRSTRATLNRLSSKPVFWSPGKPREDTIGRIPMERLQLAVTDQVAKRFGSARERGRRVMSREAADRVGLRDLRKWTQHERQAWERWSPILLLLHGLERWSSADKRALTQVVRAKGGRSELDYLALFEAHTPLKRSLLALARA